MHEKQSIFVWVLFFARKKRAPAIVHMTQLKKKKKGKRKRQLNTKMKYQKRPNASQKENRQLYKMKCLEVYNYKRSLKKRLLKKKASVHHRMCRFTTITSHVFPRI